jgi:uncharacterized Rossmann fold enzyme
MSWMTASFGVVVAFSGFTDDLKINFVAIVFSPNQISGSGFDQEVACLPIEMPAN